MQMYFVRRLKGFVGLSGAKAMGMNSNFLTIDTARGLTAKLHRVKVRP